MENSIKLRFFMTNGDGTTTGSNIEGSTVVFTAKGNLPDDMAMTCPGRLCTVRCTSRRGVA